MKRWLTLLIVWSVAIGSACAQPAASTGASQGTSATSTGQDPLLVELMHRNPRNRAYSDARLSGLPIIALTGDLGKAGDPQATSFEFLRKYGKLVGCPEGFDPARQLTLVRSASTDTSRTLAYAPARGGCPYLKSMLTMTIASEGTLVGVAGRYKQLGDVDMGSIDASKAVRMALAEVARKGHSGMISDNGSIMEFLDDGPGGRVARHYLADVMVGHPGRARQILLGPSGNVLVEMGGMQFDESAKVYPEFQNWTPAVKELKDLKHPGSFWRNWKIDGKYFTAAPAATKIDRAEAFFGHFDDDPWWHEDRYAPHKCRFGSTERGVQECSACKGKLLEEHNCNVGNPPFLEANIYYHLSIARDKAVSWGATEITTKGAMPFDHFYYVLRRLPDKSLEEPLDNAGYYHGGEGSFKFYAKNPEHDFYCPSMDPSVVYHEFGHAVHYNLNNAYDTIGGASSGATGATTSDAVEARAVAEGFADFFAASITGNPEHALMWEQKAPKKDIRTCKNDMKYFDVIPVYYTNDDDEKVPNVDRGTEIHDAGQVFSGVCWKIREKLGAEETIKLVIAGLRASAVPHSFTNACLGISTAYQEYLLKNPGSTDLTDAFNAIFAAHTIPVRVVRIE